MKNKDIERAIDYLSTGRGTCLKFIDSLTFEQLVAIPKGFKNSIYWNVAHLVVTQQLLCYKLGGEELLVSDEMVDKFRKGSVADTNYLQSDWQKVLELFKTLPEALAKDYEANKFGEYSTYETSFGVTLECIEDAIAFNNIHEGLHIGYIMALKHLV